MSETESPNAFPAKVVKVVDNFTIVINRGSAEGVKSTQRFLVYALGEELSDPDTGAPLGTLEIVKGVASAKHVQEHMATLVSDETKSHITRRTIRRTDPFSGFKSHIYSSLSAWYPGMEGLGGNVEVIEMPGEDKTMPFEGVNVTDLVKPI